MIIDLEKFISENEPSWKSLETRLDCLERNPDARIPLEDAKRLHYLYQRASADLAQVRTFASEPALRQYLETLVARAYAEIHETRSRQTRLNPLKWCRETFPQTFRRHIHAFYFSVALTVAGCLFGGLSLLFDPNAKSVVISDFEHLRQTPTERVKKEENHPDDPMLGMHSAFSSYLIQNNIKVSIKAMAFGMTYGVGTVVLLFYNGVILGSVAADYLRDGQGVFLVGWLLPHGSVEIPSILLAGQAGLVLAGTMLGWRNRLSWRTRMRRIAPDLVTLICGVSLLLVWAGFIESFFSQYHEPVLPYTFKIAFGTVELILLGCYLSLSGRKRKPEPEIP